MLLLHRGEADTAIAKYHRGDAVPARGRNERIPHGLAVVMGVNVDPAGRDQKPRRLDLALTGPLLAADSGDTATVDRHIARKRRLAAAIDDLTAANDDVIHGNRSPKKETIVQSSVRLDPNCPQTMIR